LGGKSIVKTKTIYYVSRCLRDFRWHLKKQNSGNPEYIPQNKIL